MNLKVNDRDWFKCFSKFWLDDVVIRRLPADYALMYHQLYCLCALEGQGAFIFGDADDIAWRLHRSGEYVSKALEALASLGLIDQTPTTIKIRLWESEQPKITEADRLRAYRARKNENSQSLS